jgi:DNA-3-methyladenine glycosylase II
MPRVSAKAQAAYLSERDPVLAGVIARVKLPPLKKAGAIKDRAGAHHFATLTTSIICQQISNAAAATIVRRFRDLFGGKDPTPLQVRRAKPEKLRSAGLSGSKAAYIKDLAEHVLDGRLDLDHVATLPDDELMRELVAVKGIGPWTAEMFMIFSLGREDIFSYGDVGLVNAMARLYGMRKPPSRARMERTVKVWAPYRSLAARYLWASLDAPGGP